MYVYVCIYRVVDRELKVLRREKTLERVTRIYIAIVELVSHVFGITVF